MILDMWSRKRRNHLWWLQQRRQPNRGHVHLLHCDEFRHDRRFGNLVLCLESLVQRIWHDQFHEFLRSYYKRFKLKFFGEKTYSSKETVINCLLGSKSIIWPFPAIQAPDEPQTSTPPTNWLIIRALNVLLEILLCKTLYVSLKLLSAKLRNNCISLGFCPNIFLYR